jgi:spermidine synthase
MKSSATGLVVRERGGVLEILAGNVVLLSSAALETELGFGRLAARLAGRPGPRVLIGGLGFGATLGGVLEGAPPDARVVVAEKVPEVVPIVRGRIPRLLDDPRVTLAEVDVHEEMARSDACWDCILLDVDNGPHWASFRTNARLYSPAGLAAARRALAPGGFLAVWSGYAADAFLPRLRQAGLVASCIPLHERGRVRARAYVGTRPPGGPADAI